MNDDFEQRYYDLLEKDLVSVEVSFLLNDNSALCKRDAE